MKKQTLPFTADLTVIPLQSSSKGNCVYVESCGVALLFDAGISAKKTVKRLADFGIGADKIQGLFLSHEHSDHISGAGPLHRKYQFPVYATSATLEAGEEKLKSLSEVRFFRPSAPVHIGPFTVHSMKTPHDCCEGVCFIVEAGGKYFGILTDIGKPNSTLTRALSKVDAALLESNYDPGLLQNSSYPDFVKSRIRSGNGHLSNAQAAGMLSRCGKKLKWVCLGHLSPENNRREIAYRTGSASVCKDTQVFVASRRSATGIFHI